MNPWLTEQLAAAYEADRRRAAFRANPFPELASPRRPALSPPSWLRRRLGHVLIGAGARIAGLDRELPTAVRPA